LINARLTTAQPFTAYFYGADIHELLSPDLLHQIIKGTFKDHLVDWIEAYINSAFDRARAAQILADIDRRYASHVFRVLLYLHSDTASQLRHPFQAFDVSSRAVNLNNGPAMIQRP
jgi:hypothetical protein